MIYLILILAGIGAANAIVNEFVFSWLKNLLPSWQWLQTLFNCLTCMSFWTTLIISLGFGHGWISILLALAASIIAREITIFEE